MKGVRLLGWSWGCLCLVLSCLVLRPVVARGEGGPKFLPTPKSVQVTGGEMALAATSRIVATDKSLVPLAEILSDEILLVAKLRLAPAEGEAKPGDIVLRINPQLRADADILTVQNREVKKVRDYAHTIDVADMAVVEGWDYRACCEGTATLLQAIRVDGGVALPKMKIKDWPHADFTGYMIDCARQGLPLMGLKDCIESMRYFKVRYLHLHFHDGSAFYFPLKAYPQAGSHNGAINGGDAFKSWDLEELKKTVAYADARGVTIVPEIETPGHCEALMEDLKVGDKWLLGDPGMHLMDIANDDIYPVLDTIIGEMCDVFKSSPYIHIGGDEVQWEWFIDRPHVQEFMRKNGMREKDKGGKDDLLKRHALKMNEIVKKYGKKTIFWGGYQGPPTDPELTDLIMYSWYAGAREAQDKGFTTITVPWEIRGPWEKWNIYSCNADMLNRADRVLGGSRVAWEQSAENYINTSMYEGFRQEGTWAPDTVTASMDEIRMRERTLAERLAKIIRPITIKAEGPKLEGENYSGKLNVTMTADPVAGHQIRYTIDGSEPTSASAVYDKPLELIGKLRIRAALFNDAGHVLGGYTFAQKYNWKDLEENLTKGKPVKSSGIAGMGPDAEVPENANDGWVGNGKIWGAWDPPQWWQVDLTANHRLDRVHLFPYDQGGRSFQYTIDVSTDEQKWTKVVDESANSRPVTGQGNVHTFPPVEARYVRVNMLKNSIQNAVQLEEVRVYEAGK